MELDNIGRLPIIPQLDPVLNELHTSENYTTNSESLVIVSPTKVVWFQRGAIVRSFSYKEDGTVVAACLTSFRSGSSRRSCEARHATAVIFLSTGLANIYELNGGSYTRSIPFDVQKVFPCYNGVVIQRAVDYSESSTAYDTMNLPKFFILTDAINDLGLISASSINSISPSEDMILFNEAPGSPFCVTRDLLSGSVKIYQARYLDNGMGLRKHKRSSLSGRRKSSRVSRRKSSLARTPSDSGNESDISNNLERRLSLNGSFMENTIALDRLTSSDGVVSAGEVSGKGVLSASIAGMRREAILTPIEQFDVDLSHKIGAFCMSSTVNNSHLTDKQSSKYGQDCIVLLDYEVNTVTTIVYTNTNGHSVSPSRNIASNTVTSKGALPLVSMTEGIGLVLLHVSPKELCLFDPLLNLRSPNLHLPVHWGDITELIYSYENEVLVGTQLAGKQQLSILLAPDNELVTKCFEALDLVLEPVSKQYLSFLWISALGCGLDDSWSAFCAAILCCTMTFGPQFSHLPNNSKSSSPFTDASDIITSTAWDWLLKDTSLEKKHLVWFRAAHKLGQTEFGSQFDFTNVIEYIFLCLHIMRENFKLGISTQPWVENIGDLLSIYACYGNWSEVWIRYYTLSIDTPKMPYVVSSLQQPYDEPPNILRSFMALTNGQATDFPSLSGFNAFPRHIEFKITPKILISTSIIEKARLNDTGIIKFLAENNVTSEDILDYIECVRIPLLEVFAFWRNFVEDDCDEIVYKLLCREDLCKMISIDKELSSEQSLYSPLHGKGHNVVAPDALPTKDIRSIVQSASEHDQQTFWDDPSENDCLTISKLIFSEDRRFYEVSKLLQSSRVQRATINQLPQWNEHQWLAVQQVIAHRVVLRTCANAMGRAVLFLSSRVPLVTERYSIPPLNFNIILKPSNVTVPVQKNPLSDESLAWAYFHNGVAAGLGVSRSAHHITGSWIAFNKPQILSSQYSGFLLGLGLNGHLNKLEEWHIYNYLGPKFLQASVALLIGMAASQIGSTNVKLTKVLSVHVSALLPPGSTNLNVPVPVQTAGIIGIGLLFQGNQHRRMSNILMQEIDAENDKKSEKEDAEVGAIDKDEGYRLAAGIALGFINMGKGDFLEPLHIRSSSANSSSIVDRLVELSTLPRDSRSHRIMDDSAPGAIMALAFMFMKSNNSSIAGKIAIPHREQRYDYIRPDLFYLRVLAQHLIMWDEIEDSRLWLESQIPIGLRIKYDISTLSELDSDQIPYFNVISGLCMAIGLKYASTGNENAKWTLIYYCDRILRFIESVPTDGCNHDEKVTKSSLMRNLNSICLAVSTVMASTGDVDVLRRLRRLYGEIYDGLVTVGFYMANQTALGILFMGGGQYGFNRKPFAIACLMIAFYPLHSNSLMETRYYLPALRHFWALAAENRCLVIRDVETNVPKPIDVTFKVLGDKGNPGDIVTRTAPCLIPDVEEIQWLSTVSEQHFDIHLDLLNKPNSSLVRAFRKTNTIYVYEKSALQGNTTDFSSTLQSIIDHDESSNNSVESLRKSVGWLGKLQVDLVQQKSLLDVDTKFSAQPKLEKSHLDLWLTLLAKAEKPRSIDDYWSIRVLLEFADQWSQEEDLVYLTEALVQELKLKLLKFAI